MVDSKPFFGWRVVYAAFVVAFFAWGMGFYGPPIFLQTIHENRGWSIALVSAALTAHYLTGATFIANLPRFYRLFGLPTVTGAGAVSLTIGLFGWAVAAQPWQLFLSTILSGAGWAAMSGAAINAIVPPWFVRLRPTALTWAYNGASIGGFVYSPLWVFLIARIGFPAAVLIVGAAAIVTVCYFSMFVFSHTPDTTGQRVDGDEADATARIALNEQFRLPGGALWRDWKFRTLAVAMSLSLFAQIGLLSQLFSVAVPALGAFWAGIVLALANLLSVVGRTVTGVLLPAHADRRIVAMFSYGVQILGGVVLIVSDGRSLVYLVVGIFLFGAGIGNATTLPPLIAQTEFSKEDCLRAVSLIAAMSQSIYAFAPAVFGVVRNLAHEGHPFPTSEMVSIAVVGAGVQFLAICAMFVGRLIRRMPHCHDRMAIGPLHNQDRRKGMLELRPNCECCDRDLPPSSTEARICTFECTFCAQCAEQVLGGLCPNCGGNLVARPIRPPRMLEKWPASSKRVLKEGGCVSLA